MNFKLHALLISMVKSHAALFWSAWQANSTFVEQTVMHEVSTYLGYQVITMMIITPCCLCSHNSS